MNILSYEDVEKYLKNRQVYFKIEVANIDLKTIAEPFRVHNMETVEAKRISNDTAVVTMSINGFETSIYQYMSDIEFFSWIKRNFIPVQELIENYNHA